MKRIFLKASEEDFIVFRKHPDGNYEAGQLRLMNDGEYVFFPNQSIMCFSGRVLAEIADVCNKLNLPWEEDIREYLEEIQNEHRAA